MKKLLLAILFTILSSCAWANVPNSTPLFNQYNCNSSTTQFPYSFPITAPTDMTVYITDNNGNIAQQNGTFYVDQTNVWVAYPLTGSPCPTGYTITLIPFTPQTQTTTYGNRTPFTAPAVGASFDKLTLIAQQLQGQINRAFLQPVNFTGTATFPGPVPGYLLGWNSSSQIANIANPSLVAQWSLNGANIYYNTGNVGIGTVSPAESFNVLGNIKLGNSAISDAFLEGTVNTSDEVIIGQNATNIVIGSGDPANAWTGIDFYSAGNIREIIDAVGNFGIGTSLPATLLDVNRILNVTNTGNVGVGSISPGQALDVQGTIRASLGIDAVGIGTTVPQEICISGGKFGYFNGVWNGTCTTRSS